MDLLNHRRKMALGQNTASNSANPSTYLSDLKKELQIEWPKNRTINIVFHGHSVPAGYFKTQQNNRWNATDGTHEVELTPVYHPLAPEVSKANEYKKQIIF